MCIHCSGGGCSLGMCFSLLDVFIAVDSAVSNASVVAAVSGGCGPNAGGAT